MSVVSEIERLSFQAEIQQLLSILAHSLYSDRETFLRELISNASDALHRVRFESLTNRDVRDADSELEIRITTNEDAGTLTIEDSGIGMTRDELVKNLGTIAHSGIRELAQQLEANKRGGLIGNFGVGFYSSFVTANDVTVTSLSYRPDAEAAVWHSNGDGTFEVGPAMRDKRGTSITLRLKDDAREFLSTERLSHVIRRHSSFVTFPIYVGHKHINENHTALWRKEPREVDSKDYADFYRQFSFDFQDPLTQMHVSTDAPVDLHAVLFIRPSRTSFLGGSDQKGKVQLYSRRVLIKEDAIDLLPSHFRFVTGIVDSDDIPLNVSREMVQGGPVLAKLKTALSGRLRKALSDLAEKEPEKYALFWREFGVYIKEGIASDSSTCDELAPLLRFQSTKVTDRTISLSEYRAAMPEGLQEILYLFGPNIDALRNSPHLETVKNGDSNVLLMDDVVDAFMLANLKEFEGHKLTSLDASDESDNQESPRVAEQLASVIAVAKDLLGKQVSDIRVSDRLQNSPVRLVASANGHSQDMERAYRMMGKDYPSSPKVLELNPNHEIIRKLAAANTIEARQPLVKDVIHQLYDHARIQEGLLTSPRTMIERIERFMESALNNGG